MRPALHAEWTKVRTLASTGWLLVGAVVLTVAVGAVAASGVSCPSYDCALDPARTSLTGIDLGQAVVALLAVLVISDEYRTGMIRLTLTAMPRRTTVLAAKALILVGLVLVAATLAVVGSILAGRFILAGHGFTPVHGYPLLSLGTGPVLRAAAGSVLYLGLIALLGIGAAVAVRDSALAIGLVLGVLYLPTILFGLVTDPTWQRRLQQIAPMQAGLASQHTIGVSGLPIGPWSGLGVLGAWAAGTALVGWLVLRLRDA